MSQALLPGVLSKKGRDLRGGSALAPARVVTPDLTLVYVLVLSLIGAWAAEAPPDSSAVTSQGPTYPGTIDLADARPLSPVPFENEDRPHAAGPGLLFAVADTDPDSVGETGFRPTPLSLNSSAQANVTISTNPQGLDIVVDGIRTVAPQALVWDIGSEHNVSAGQQAETGGVRKNFTGWSDGLPADHIVHVDGPLDLVATFETEYLVAISTEPPNREIKIDEVPFPTPYASWWRAGSSFDLVALSQDFPSPGTKLGFRGWSDNGTNGHLRAVDGPLSLVGRYGTSFFLTLETPFGQADCGPSLPAQCWYDAGTNAEFRLTSVPGPVGGTRQDFRGWSTQPGNGFLVGSVVMDGPKRVEALWVEQHYLSVETSYGQASGGGWHDAGSVATVSIANPEVNTDAGRHRFVGWTGPVNSPATEITVPMDGPKTVVAEWVPVAAAPPGGILVDPVAAPALALAALAAGGIVYFSTPRGEFALGGLAVPLFTRLRPDGVRNQFTRGRLLGFIEGNPGASYTQVRRTLSLSNGACAYHLRVLERNGDIRRVVRGASVRFYGVDFRFDADALPPLAYLQRRILEDIVESGSTTFAQISAALAGRGLVVTDTNLGYHLSVLAREKQLITTRREGRKTVYFVDEEQREYLRRRLKEEAGVDEAMDTAALSGGEPTLGDLDGRALWPKGDVVVTIEEPEPVGEKKANFKDGTP